MASTIVTKNSSTASAVPVAGDLTKGELAVNVTDKKLYTKDNGGSVVKLVGGLGNQEANAVAITGGAIDGTAIGGTTASTASFTTVSASGNVTLSGGTANGVAYLNGSKVVTSGSALTFDGQTLTNTRDTPILVLNDTAASNSALRLLSTGGISYIQSGISGGSFASLAFTSNGGGSEQMRLTSTGLGIRTSSPGYTLDVNGSFRTYANNAAAYQYAYINNTASNGYARLDFLIGASGANGTATVKYAPGVFMQIGPDTNDTTTPLVFATNNATERARIDSSGNFGIGTSSPSYKLDVNGVTRLGAGSPAILAGVGGAFAGGQGELYTIGTNTMGIGTTGAAALRLYTNSTLQATIDSSGNLGLGVTPSAWSGAVPKAIQFPGNAAVNAGSALYATTNAYFNGTSWIYQNTDLASYYIQNAGTHKWYNAPSGTAGNAITFTQAMMLTAGSTLELKGTSAGLLLDRRDNNNNAYQIYSAAGSLQFYSYTSGSDAMTLDASGNLGIGTSSPAEKLAVAGNATAEIYKLRANTSAPASTDAFIFRPADNTLGFGTASAEKMRLDSSGNLLVGTTSTNPTNGFVANQNGGNGFYLQIGHPTGTGSGVAYERYMYNQTEIGSITQSGTTAVLYNITSDQRLKENIVDAPEFGSVIDSIKVRSYDWKADGNHQRAGFVAQELVTVAPEAVHQPADPEEMMAVDYSKLVPMLVKEIQSLRKRLADAGIA